MVIRTKQGGDGVLVLLWAAAVGKVAGFTLACVAGQDAHGVLTGWVKS